MNPMVLNDTLKFGFLLHKDGDLSYSILLTRMVDKTDFSLNKATFHVNIEKIVFWEEI